MGIQDGRQQGLLTEILKLAARKTLVVSNVDTETAERRLAICVGCERFNQTERKCLDCGCFMDEKTKSFENRNPRKMRYEITHCPNGFWGDKETANIYRQMDGKELLP